MIKPYDPMDDFVRDIPEHLHDDILTQICEALHYPDDTSKNVCVYEHDRINATNVRGKGTVTIDDEEYEFIAESGDNNGFRFESWNDDRTFERHKPTVWTLAPSSELIANADTDVKKKALLDSWDRLMDRSEISKIASDYTYDRHFQPGTVIERHYRAKASNINMQLVDSEYAEEIRKSLSAGAEQ